ncbi:MAG: DNA-binding protein [Rhodocyclales bacterium GWA2_65_19]|nr:MAG: DNA-binding protein [Rhodocyclales bacterium GWA2_65_19]
MTLANLLKINRLQTFVPSAAGIQLLLDSAARNLNDAHLDGLSPDNRFDAAYKTIMQCAMIGLWANGYRTSTSQPGHHQTALQALPHTLGLPGDSVIVFDALRKQRNINDYEGNPVTETAVTECIRQAENLLTHTRKWLKANHPALLDL